MRRIVFDAWFGVCAGAIVLSCGGSDTLAGSGAEMLACLDYIIAENSSPGSLFEGHVDVDRVGASGHSQGGGGSVAAGADPRVKTTAPVQPWFGLTDTSLQSQQTGPMFIMSGEADTISPPAVQQEPLFNNSNVPTFWGILAGADHINSVLGNLNGYRGPSTAWFRFLLMDDTTAAPLFCGPSCGLCVDPDWTVQTKDL